MTYKQSVPVAKKRWRSSGLRTSASCTRCVGVCRCSCTRLKCRRHASANQCSLVPKPPETSTPHRDLPMALLVVGVTLWRRVTVL